MFELSKELLDDVLSAVTTDQLPMQTNLPVSFIVCGTCQNTCKGNCLNTCTRVGKGKRW